MAIDLSGFVTPEQQFGGLYKATDTLERRRYREQELKSNKDAQKASNAKFFSNYFDPKDHLTGTNFDKVTVDLLNNALNQAYELSAKGAPIDQIMMAAAPLVNKVNNYTRNAKIYSQNKKDILDKVKSMTGIDATKLSSEIDKRAFINPDTGEIDVDRYDPNINYADQALREGDIYNNEGFDAFSKQAKANTLIGNTKYINSKGGYEKSKVKLTAPNYLISETDADGNHIGFVPKYEVATDQGKELMHDFLGDNGEKVSAPVRLLDKQIFNDLPTSAKGYLRQEVKKYSDKMGVPMNSTQAEQFARALAYNELNADTKKWGTVENIIETKENPAPRINIRVNAGGGSTPGIGSTNLLGEYTNNASETKGSILMGGKIGDARIVRVKNIDPGDFKIITAGDNVTPLSDADGEYFIVDNNGDWLGEGNQRISQMAVSNRVLDKISQNEAKRGGSANRFNTPLNNKQKRTVVSGKDF